MGKIFLYLFLHLPVKCNRIFTNHSIPTLMKQILFILLIAICTSSLTKSENTLNQESKPGPKFFYFGAGVNVGFFYPTDINDYLEDRYSNYILEFGMYGMIMYYTINIDGAFFFCRYTELKLELECSASPKFISADETDFYLFNRITPALKFNFHIPAGSRMSVYLGPGVNYNRLKFKGPDFTNTRTCIGLSGQAGVMVRFRKFAIQPGFTFNYIKAEGNAPNFFNGDTYAYPNTMDYSYTGGQIGCTFYF